MSKTTDVVKADAKMDMTPMIDCVFLLMIFFVLVIDLSQKDLEDLILPKAVFQQPDDKPPPIRPIINIVQDGKVVYGGKTQYDPKIHGNNFTGIKNLLAYFKQSIVPPEEKEKTNLGGKTVELVNTPVLIRADKWTEWHFVGKVMEQCSDPELAFWKLELAMSEEDKEEKFFKGR